MSEPEDEVKTGVKTGVATGVIETAGPAAPPRIPRRRLVLAIGAAALVLVLFGVSQLVCLRAWLKHGILVPTCPDGKPQQTLYVECNGLGRGVEGDVYVGAVANYTTGEADSGETASVRRLQATLALVKPTVTVKGGTEEVALAPAKGWQRDGRHARLGRVALPKDLPDGDYLLRARVRSPLGESTLDLPLPVYAPARIHVITDRPLYEPGHTVQFRAVVLRAADLAPTDGRPGRWIVHDPSGEMVLEERAPAGDFGVVAGSFPLDAGAATGSWRVRWVSGDAEDSVAFQVEPFRLPRFRVEASAGKPFFRAGDHPTVRGKVTYSSGAPVRSAAVDVSWSVKGEWPPPTDWLGEGARALPRHAVTDGAGAFELALPTVPADLKGSVTLAARLSAVDAAGDRVDGAAAVLLSEDAIRVSTVTELDDGLVQGFNNRLYLRATTAAGAVLAGVELVVRRAWEPNDRGIRATTDEDGVAALQIDPGPPVNVVVPPMPTRAPPRPPAAARTGAEDLIGGDEPSLGDRLALDRWAGALAPCARFVAAGSQEVSVAVRVSAAGAVTATAGTGDAPSTCFQQALAGRRLPPGRERLYGLQYDLNASDLPQLSVEVRGAPAVRAGIEAALQAAALDARSCLPDDSVEASLPRLLVFQSRAHAQAHAQARPRKKAAASTAAPTVVVTTSFVRDPELADRVVAAPVAACIEKKIGAIDWPAALAQALGSDGNAADEGDEGEGTAAAGSLGVARFSVEPSPRHQDEEQAPATTVLGYELGVSAGDKGSTRLLVRPGQVPPIRLRASPVLAGPGGTVDVSILRGPSFSDALPEKLTMTHRHGSIEAKVDAKARSARFKLPGDARGWYAVSWSGAEARVYVRPQAELAVAIKPGAPRYRPGQMAELTVETTAGKRGTRAAVTLVGVDASLAQLATLPGPDDMARLRPRPQMRAAAFDVLDASALEMGGIRGANAATATVLRIGSLPDPAASDTSVSARAETPFLPLEALTDNFYVILGELHLATRAWEEKAPKDEQMRPATMAKLWAVALEACEKRKQPVTDAYGRRLRLSRLPADLLALTDPRAVVVSGTRLPEDIESWPAWVAKEKP